jgi:hypothetical protein
MTEKSAIEVAHTRIALRNTLIEYIGRVVAPKILRHGGQVRKVRRLNMESAIRRSLVGAKGMR